MLDVKAIFADGTESEFMMTAAGADATPQANVVTLPGTALEIARVSLASTFEMVPEEVLEFEKQCVPLNPVYIRWINTDGGWDYWMFGASEDRAEQEVTNSYSRFIESNLLNIQSRQVVSLAAVDTLTVIEEQVSKENFEWLRKLPLSPKIEMYNTRHAVWFEVTLDDNATTVWSSASVRGLCEFTFRVRDRKVQY